VITNERQYRIAKAELRRFEEAIETHRVSAPSDGVDPHIHKAIGASLQSEADGLRDQIARYEDLREGRVRKRELEGLRDLPTALIEARITAGLTQKALAEKLDVQEQQIQRWEANLYSGVGVERLQEVADAMGMGVRETVSYAVAA
jgi:ribosome-binding protein aMBF1 (putative translation factor)